MKKLLDEAKDWLNKHEVTHNYMLKRYLRDNLSKPINPAQTAWCAAFVNAVLNAQGYSGTNSFLARSFLKWGVTVPLAKARPGDIVVLKRGKLPWQGHVGFYADRLGKNIVLLGGNQANKVCYKAYPLKSLLGIRRPGK